MSKEGETLGEGLNMRSIGGGTFGGDIGALGMVREGKGEGD